MNTNSTKTNAAAIPTRMLLDTTTQPVAVFSLSSIKGGEGWGEEASFIGCPPQPSAPRGDGARRAREGNLHVSKFSHGSLIAYAPIHVRRAPAFAPLHRFINCLMAEASDRTE